VHFRRYLAENQEDVETFQNVLMTFAGRLPLPEAPDLLADWEFLYERSTGCVGVLKEWLERAVTRALKGGQRLLGRQHLAATALSVSQCEKILAESHDGESQLTDTEEARSRLRARLGLRSSSPPKDTAVVSQGADQVILPPAKKRGRAGRRRPRRDSVGVHACATGESYAL
jgi:hypothetical protein